MTGRDFSGEVSYHRWRLAPYSRYVLDVSRTSDRGYSRNIIFCGSTDHSRWACRRLLDHVSLAYPVSGTAKRGKIPSENPISKIIPSDFSPAIVRTGRLLPTRPCRPSFSAFGFGRILLRPSQRGGRALARPAAKRTGRAVVSLTPAANSWRTPPLHPRASPRSRA